MPKTKSLWEDRSIQWFYTSSSPGPKASIGSIPNESRIDRANDGTEIRICYDAIHKALEALEKPQRWSEKYKLDGLNSASNRSQLARDPAFFNLHQRSFWPTRIGYKVDKPKLMSHFFSISIAHCLENGERVFNRLCIFPGGRVASSPVRQIVEQLQPGYAKFFPVQLAFKDQVVDGYSWIVQPIRVFAKCFVPDGKGGRHLLDNGDYDWDGYTLEGDAPLRMRRSKLAGLHWTLEEDGKYIWSNEAVHRFAPFVLSREKNWLTGLRPITVIED
jgi:hypothetical protein